MTLVDKRIGAVPVDERIGAVPVDERIGAVPVDERIVAVPVDERIGAVLVDERMVVVPVPVTALFAGVHSYPSNAGLSSEASTAMARPIATIPAVNFIVAVEEGD